MATIDELLARARETLDRVTLDDLPRGAVLVDIREDHQIARHGKLPGAIRIPRNVLEWRCDPASPWRDARVSDPSKPVVLVCHEGYQSSLAAATLQALGHPRATDLIGGFSEIEPAALGRLAGDPPPAPSSSPSLSAAGASSPRRPAAASGGSATAAAAG